MRSKREPDVNELAANATRQSIAQARALLLAGEYVPETREAFEAARTFHPVTYLSAEADSAQLSCSHRITVPPDNPVRLFGELRYCDQCTFLAYRRVMLEKYEEELARLGGPKTGCMLPLVVFVVLVLLSGCLLQAWASWRASEHAAGAFDPRSDDYAEGQCP